MGRKVTIRECQCGRGRGRRILAPKRRQCLQGTYPDLSREKATKNANASVEIEVRNFGLLPTVGEESTGLLREFRVRDMMDDAYFTIEDFV